MTSFLYELLYLSFRNSDLPAEFQLPPDLFQITPFAFGQIEAANLRRLEAIRSSVEAETTEAAAALLRIRARFFNDVLEPRIVVRGIRKASLASSRCVYHHYFRTGPAKCSRASA